MKTLQDLMNKGVISAGINSEWGRISLIFRDNPKFNYDYYKKISDYFLDDFLDYMDIYGDLELRHPDMKFNMRKIVSIIKTNYYQWILTYKVQFDTLINDLGTTQNINTLHSDGYAGFSLDNQEGDFQKRRGDTNINTLSNATILDFIQNFKGNVFDKIWEEIANTLLVVIY